MNRYRTPDASSMPQPSINRQMVVCVVVVGQPSRTARRLDYRNMLILGYKNWATSGCGSNSAYYFCWRLGAWLCISFILHESQFLPTTHHPESTHRLCHVEFFLPIRTSINDLDQFLSAHQSPGRALRARGSLFLSSHREINFIPPPRLSNTPGTTIKVPFDLREV